MKKLLLISLIALLSCAKSDPAPFTSLVGDWTFDIPRVANGEFTIATYSGALTVDNYGKFVVHGNLYTIGVRRKTEMGKSGEISRLWLIEVSGKNQFVFDNLTFDSTYRTLTAHAFFYVENSVTSMSFVETVTIRRR